MPRVSDCSLALFLSMAIVGSADAQQTTFRDPYVAVSKSGRAAADQSAAVSIPAPERFGPVVVQPAPPDIVSAPASPDQPTATFALPKPSQALPEAGCLLESTLAGTEAKALIAKIATEEEFDLTLLSAIAKQESDFRMDQRSPAGAIGLMQLMPATAKALGVNPCDPEQNIRGSIKLLRLLDTKYGGNIIYILAAYNAGEDAVDRNGGIPPYRETITYVTRILSNLNGWDIPRAGKANHAATSQKTTDNEPPKPAANRWAQGFVLHVE